MRTAAEKAFKTPVKFTWNKRAYKAAYARSRHFIFTPEASHRLGEIIDTCGAQMIENAQFALPPHPVTYIEIDLKLLFNGLYKDTAPISPKTLAFLITEESIVPFIEIDEGALLCAFSYHKHKSDRINFVVEGDHEREKFELTKAILMLGNTHHKLEDPLVLNQEWGVGDTYGKVNYTPDMIKAHIGEFRVALCALLLLNQPNTIHLEPIKSRKNLGINGRKRYAAHSTVNINLGERKQYKKYFGHVLRSSPRRHEVRGHFAHYHCKPNCEHEWPTMPNEDMQWCCKHCGGLRVWRKAHTRGDAGVGFVTKNYEVQY